MRQQLQQRAYEGGGAQWLKIIKIVSLGLLFKLCGVKISFAKNP